MYVPGKATSYWLDTVPETQYPLMPAGTEVDVAVLGGGIVGITTAYLLKQAGMRVALVEARKLLHGVTGHTTAKLTSQHTVKYHQLIEKVGRERTAMYAAANQAAIEFVADSAATLGIDCDFRRISACTFTEEEQHLAAIEQETRVTDSLKLPVHFHRQADLPFKTLASLCFSEQGLFHPLKYLRGLAERIPGDGSFIFEHTVAQDVDDAPIREVTTNHGKLRARHVVVATHFPFLDRGLYFTRLTPRRSYVIACRLGEPVPDAFYISADRHTIRPHPTDDGWIVLLGGEGHVTGNGGDTVERYRRAEEWARSHFDVRSIEYHWSTQDNSTPDGLPFAGKYLPGSDGLWVAAGFDGWGMSNGIASATILAEMIQGHESPWAPAYAPSRFEQLTAVGKYVSAGARFVQHEVLDRIERHEKASEIVLAKGEGRVVDYKGSKVAVYADEEGALHGLSAACAHQGCIVTWNSAEQSWDCPCHGSRYTATGQFIHGPTVHDLTPVTLETT